MDRAIYDRMAEIDGEHWWFAARRRIVAQLIEDRVKPPRPARILEVGCGTGSNLSLLQRYGVVDAIEPDEGARALASRRGGISVSGGLLPQDGAMLEDGRYDLIVLLDVLEHIPDDVGSLKVLKTKLAPGGALLMTVPAAPWMWSSHDAAHHHQRRYTAKTLRAAMMVGGFKVRHMSHFNSLLFPLIAGIRLIGKATGRAGGDDSMPSGLVNKTLETVFAAERHWVTRRSLPVGVSLLTIGDPS